MVETKSITVAPENENQAVNTMASFGWGLKSSQEINTKESHLEERFGDLYSVVTKEHYVKLVFERDNKMENYQRIVELETTYFDIMGRRPEPKNINVRVGVAIICFVLYIIPGIIYLASKSQAKKKFEKAYAEWQEEEKIAIKALNEARSLV